MTMSGPYKDTGNGYFGAWCALIMSWMLAIQFLPGLKGPLDSLVEAGGKVIALLLLASVAVLVQTSFNCIEYGGWCRGEARWILACSGISLLVALILVIPQFSSRLQQGFKYIALFLALWWAAGFFVATFDAPYVRTGNGFFGCWVAFATSLVLLDSSWDINARGQADAAVRRAPRELIVIFVASVVVLVASCYGLELNGFYDFWALICSGVSLGLSFIALSMLISGVGKDRIANLMPNLAAILLAWWIFGTGFMTFGGPFRATSNGYFGAWIALVAAWLLWTLHFDQSRVMLALLGDRSGEFVIVVVAALVLLVQALIDGLNRHFEFNGNLIYAVICSAVTLAFNILLIFFGNKVQAFFKWAVLVLALMWVVAVVLLTFGSPYTYTGNAYFACWAAFAASSLLSLHLLAESGPSADTTGAHKTSAASPRVMGIPGM